MKINPSTVFRHFHLCHWLASLACFALVATIVSLAAFVTINFGISSFYRPGTTPQEVSPLFHHLVAALGNIDLSIDNFVLIMLIISVILTPRIVSFWRNRIYRSVYFDIECEHIPSNGSSLDVDVLFEQIKPPLP